MNPGSAPPSGPDIQIRPPARERETMASLQRRAANIGFRTAHIGVTGALFGGHVFNVPAPALLPFLWVAIATGAGLILIESHFGSRWLHQGNGLMVLAKLALLCVVPFAWSARVAILVLVVVLASVGSHMPARFRCYSVIDRQVIKCT
jgi:hypothetical protein